MAAEFWWFYGCLLALGASVLLVAEVTRLGTVVMLVAVGCLAAGWLVGR
jgi:hypothetical protein